MRILFLGAAAFFAFAVADPILETASNNGLFGPGNFTDHSNADALPAVLCGAILLAIHLITRGCYIAARRGMNLRELWAGALDARTVIRLLPLVFACQIALLFALETGEQMLVAGHIMGGTLWLGAPVVISLAFHAFVCVGVTLGAGYVTRLAAARAVQILRFALAFLLALSSPPSVFRTHERVSLYRTSLLRIRPGGERAPPLLFS